MSKKDIDYLMSEREEAFARIVQLEEVVAQAVEELKNIRQLAQSKTIADEEVAKELAAKFQEDVDSISTTKESVEVILRELQAYMTDYKANQELLASAIDKAETLETKVKEMTEISTEITSKQTTIQSNLTSSEQQLLSYNELATSIDEIHNKIKAIHTKANSILTSTAQHRAEVEELRDEILGYDTENEESGDIEHVSGLKEELDNTYKTLQKQMSDLSAYFEGFKTEQKDKLTKSITDTKDERDNLIKEIRSYLPDAVSAGLAGAYQTKAKDETDVMDNNTKFFGWIIVALLVVGLLQVGISVALLFTGKTLLEVIEYTPQVVLAMLPLYAPLVWIAIHTNKKINLSKKLVEEYAYKGAVSNSVTGLTEQIKLISDKDNSQEMHTKLIELIVTKSGENPGQFIDGYSKSDNPVQEFISAFEKIEKIIVENPKIKEFISVSKKDKVSLDDTTD